MRQGAFSVLLQRKSNRYGGMRLSLESGRGGSAEYRGVSEQSGIHAVFRHNELP